MNNLPTTCPTRGDAYRRYRAAQDRRDAGIVVRYDRNRRDVLGAGRVSREWLRQQLFELFDGDREAAIEYFRSLIRGDR